MDMDIIIADRIDITWHNDITSSRTVVGTTLMQGQWCFVIIQSHLHVYWMYSYYARRQVEHQIWPKVTDSLDMNWAPNLSTANFATGSPREKSNSSTSSMVRWLKVAHHFPNQIVHVWGIYLHSSTPTRQRAKCIQMLIPVVPHKAVAEVSKIGNL